MCYDKMRCFLLIINNLFYLLAYVNSCFSTVLFLPLLNRFFIPQDQFNSTDFFQNFYLRILHSVKIVVLLNFSIFLSFVLDPYIPSVDGPAAFWPYSRLCLALLEPKEQPTFPEPDVQPLLSLNSLVTLKMPYSLY